MKPMPSVVLLALSLSSFEAAAASPQLCGRGFCVPRIKNFDAVVNPLLLADVAEGGGVMAVESGKNGTSGVAIVFTTSLLIMPVPNNAADVSDKGGCERVANEIAAVKGRTSSPVRLRSRARTSFCEFDAVKDASDILETVSIVSVASRQYVATCRYHSTRRIGLKDCMAMLDGLRIN